MTAAAPKYAALIMAGGKSTRLGRDKASEMLLGRPLLQQVMDRVTPVVDEIVVVKARGQQLPDVASSLPLRVVEDLYPDCGPLGGIFTGLNSTVAARCLAVACDMPLLSEPLLRELLLRSTECDVVMPVLQYPEPLHAVYGRACIEPIRERLEARQFKITNFLGAVNVCYMREDDCRRLDPDLRSFSNTNTEEALNRARELLATEGGGSG